jgi:O-antigen/teichoic acid export membrane protein
MSIILGLIKRAWESPTLMTWGSFLSRSLNLILVTPLILTKFSTPEISLWFLFSTMISMQLLADLGFAPTFSRVIAYAMGGANYDELSDYRKLKGQKKNDGPNWDTVERIFATMSFVYTWLTVILVTLFAILGTISLLKPISLVCDSMSAWICWIIIILSSAFSLKGNSYSAYLQGTNNIAPLRRCEIYVSLCSIFSNFIVLLCGGNLLGLVLSHQIWRIVNILINRYLSAMVADKKIQSFQRKEKDIVVLKSVWPSTWRSGAGHFMSYGLIQASGIFYAQIGTTSSIASYLLALRLIHIVSEFSQAPFYSKLPTFARLFAEGKKKELVGYARKGMRLSYWCYVAGFMGLDFAGQPLLNLIGSNAVFPTNLLWSLLGLGFFAQRYGAMHIQLYSVTNKIIWHISNGISGAIYLIVSLVLIHPFGVYAFPIGILVGYLCFHTWFPAVHSYKTFGLRFMSFEKATMLGPLSVILLYIILLAGRQIST